MLRFIKNLFNLAKIKDVSKDDLKNGAIKIFNLYYSALCDDNKQLIEKETNELIKRIERKINISEINKAEKKYSNVIKTK